MALSRPIKAQSAKSKKPQTLFVALATPGRRSRREGQARPFDCAQGRLSEPSRQRAIWSSSHTTNPSAGCSEPRNDTRAEPAELFLFHDVLLALLVGDQLVRVRSDPDIGATGRVAGLFAGEIDEQHIADGEFGELHLLVAFPDASAGGDEKFGAGDVGWSFHVAVVVLHFGNLAGHVQFPFVKLQRFDAVCDDVGGEK